LAKMVLSTPVCSDMFPTSVRRPFFNAGLSSMLHSGEEDGLDFNIYHFSKVLSTNTRDLCIFFLFLEVLCNKFVPPLLFY
jgi:hypothetical protein